MRELSNHTARKPQGAARSFSDKSSQQGWDVAWLVGCLSRIHEVLGVALKRDIGQVWRLMPMISALGRWKQRDQEFKVI